MRRCPEGGVLSIDGFTREMKKLYLLKPPSNWGQDGFVNAAHTAYIPGVSCPVCGVWATTGVEYPTVDPPSDVRIPLGFLDIERHRVLMDQISRLCVPGRHCPPGTKLGPLVGTAEGVLHSIEWINPWSFLVERKRWDQLCNFLGEEAVQGRVAELRVLDSQTERWFVEPEISVTARISSEQVEMECKTCGRTTVRKSALDKIKLASCRAGLALQRIVELPTYIVASEAFINGLDDEEREGLVDVSTRVDCAMESCA